jgi:alkanesulfonate monooxygenase SsuD/methylene tetrahydromethanopterin reductase-like flavin-dependent oxidoreductase (luciferase family)
MRGGPVGLGILLWSQGTGWPGFAVAATRVEALGYDHLWTWDHLLPIFGHPRQPILEGWTALAALAATTARVRLGLLVTANTFRNPALVAKMATTVDHISGGRCTLGLGGAWFALEHEAYGIDFGSGPGERLDRLDEAASLLRRLLDGEPVDHTGPQYRTRSLQLDPPPRDGRIPLVIGGLGEHKTLRTVARYADMWNAFGHPALLRRKAEVLRARCDEVGRDPGTIELSVACKPFIRDSEGAARRAFGETLARNHVDAADVAEDASFWVGTPRQLADRMLELREGGFDTFIGEMAAPYDDETLERFAGEVRPLVAAG